MTGIRENAAQFALLVLINALVGATIGLERSLLPGIAESEFQLGAHTAMLSFIAVFGFAKALTNYVAGLLSDRIGRRQGTQNGDDTQLTFSSHVLKSMHMYGLRSVPNSGSMYFANSTPWSVL